MRTVFSICIAACIAVAAAQAPAWEAPKCRLCLFGPDNMVFDRSGNIYLDDTDGKLHSRLLQLSKNGEIRKDWRVFTAAPGARNGPEGLAFTAGGKILVTDGGASRILKMDPTRGVVGLFEPGFSFTDLGHIAADSKGNVYVAEANPNLLYKFSARGRLLARWHRANGSGPNQWGGPQTIAVQPGGNIVVEDWKNRRVEILSPSGRTLRTFGGVGRSVGHFLLTAGLGVDSQSNIYVADMALHRLQEFDTSGHFLRVIGNSPGRKVFVEGPTAVAVDSRGTLYAPDGKSLLRLSNNGTVLSRWR